MTPLLGKQASQRLAPNAEPSVSRLKWEAEKSKLVREQLQNDLFTEDQVTKQIKQLRKLPYDFYYRYLTETPDGAMEHRHKIVDWEAGQLFWNCQKSHRHDWAAPFRRKLFNDLSNKDLMLLMGNMHRFQDQWLVISLIYPPKQQFPEAIQYELF